MRTRHWHVSPSPMPTTYRPRDANEVSRTSSGVSAAAPRRVAVGLGIETPVSEFARSGTTAEDTEVAWRTGNSTRCAAGKASVDGGTTLSVVLKTAAAMIGTSTAAGGESKTTRHC